MLRVGLTGGIASGKTTISQFFARLGVPIIDTDIISHRLMQPGETAFEQTVQHFGQVVLKQDGTLDRAALRQIVFKQPAQKKWLEDMLHPLIRQHTLRQAEQLDHQADYCLIVVPLLFETGFERLVDRVIAIDCPASRQQARLMLRDKIEAKLADNMIASQMRNAQRLARADFIIHNATDEDLQPQLLQLHESILKIAHQHAG